MGRHSEWRGTDQSCQMCGAAVLARLSHVDVAQSSWPARSHTEMRCSDQTCLDSYGSWIDNGLGRY
jgi:hypothetical protein